MLHCSNIRHKTTTTPSLSDMATNTDTQSSDTCGLISPEKVGNYGAAYLKIIASSDPKNATYTSPPGGGYLLPNLPRRQFDVCLDAEFSKCWHDQLEKDVLEILKVSFATKKEWSLNVLRLGFDKDSSNNPITVLIVFENRGNQDSDDANVLRTVRLLNDRRKYFWSSGG
jgi:hypothetical protein